MGRLRTHGAFLRGSVDCSGSTLSTTETFSKTHSSEAGRTRLEGILSDLSFALRQVTDLFGYRLSHRGESSPCVQGGDRRVAS